LTIPPHAPAAVGHTRSTMLLGHLMTGGSVSRRTVIVKEQVSEFWQASKTRHITVVTPMGNGAPTGGWQMTL